MFRFLLPTILIGSSIAGFFLIAKPEYDQIVEDNREIASFDEALNNSKALEAERDKLTEKYNSFKKEDLDKLQKFLPDSVDNIRLILEVEQIAKPYGMALREVKYDTTKKDESAKATSVQGIKNVSNKDYGTWDLEFSTQGSYTNFNSFIKDLERNLRIVDISSIQFSTSVNNNIGGLNPSLPEAYKYSFRIKTYWLKN